MCHFRQMLTRLTGLYLGDTAMTEAGWQRLKLALPQVKLERSPTSR